MMCFARACTVNSMMLVWMALAFTAVVAVAIVASLTSWWILTLLPVVMMIGCMAMMAGMVRR